MVALSHAPKTWRKNIDLFLTCLQVAVHNMEAIVHAGSSDEVWVTGVPFYSPDSSAQPYLLQRSSHISSVPDNKSLIIAMK